MIPPSVSIRVASYIHRLLKRRVSEDLRVKWPNDLYTQEGKVAGILIEKTSSAQMDYMVIGVGINRGRIPKEVNDSYRAANLTDFALNEFLEELVLDLMSLNFNTGLSEAEMSYWQEYDLFEWEKPLLMVDKERSKVMTYSGLSSDGLALVSDENGLTRLFSGQSSLRLIEG
jgi:BirA family biotin operon repressor/biotin-[acetyl-CoA-carboxylase] ligase